MDKKEKKTIIELDELEKVTGGTAKPPKKEPSPISDDTKKNV